MSKKKKKVHGMTPKEAAAARKEIEYDSSGKSDFQEWWSRQPTRAKVGSIGSFLLIVAILVLLFVVPYWMFN